MDDDRFRKYSFVLDWYKKFFYDNSRANWYSETIEALSISLVKYSREYEREKNQPIYLRLKEFDLNAMAPEFAIENQIGLILVLCQTYILNICKNVDMFYKEYESLYDRPITVIPHKKHELMQNYGTSISDTGYKDIEIINALANYYKHQEEWNGNDSSITLRTKKILKSIGGDTELSFYWAKNLSKLIGILGVQIDSVKKLLQIVDNWKFSIRDAIPELKS